LASEEKAEKVFIRKASGMVRGYNLTDMFVFNMNGLAPAAMMSTMIALSTAYYPGSNVLWTLLMSIPFVLCFALSYGTLAAAMPRSGGDYTFGSRVLHPVAGIMGGWMYDIVVHLIADAIFPIYFFTYVIPLTLVLSFPGNATVQAIVPMMQETWVIAAFGLIVIWVACLVAVIGRSAWRPAQYLFCIAGFVSVVIIVVILASSTQTGFIAAFDRFAAGYGTSYSAITQTAAAEGWAPAPFSVWASVAPITYMYMYIFTAWPIYMASEVKSGEKAVPKSIVSSIMTALGIAIVIAALYYYAIPNDFFSALSYLAYVAPASYPFPAFHNPEMITLMNVLYPNPITTLLVGLGLTLWNLSFVFGDFVITVRCLLYWAFDRLLPQQFASVSPRWKTPAFALVFYAICLSIVLVLELQFHTIGVITNMAVMVAVGFLPAQIACAFLASRAKNIWEKGPSWIQRKVAGIPIPTIYGTISSIFETFIILAYLFIFPAFGGPVTPVTIGFIVAMLLICIPWYYYARYYHMKKEGIDIAWAFKEVPPA
jgi:amino acid transporter